MNWLEFVKLIVFYFTTVILSLGGVSDSAFFLLHNHDEDGILLLEVNRMLRAGGYFAWAAQPVYKHEEAQEKHWEGITT